MQKLTQPHHQQILNLTTENPYITLFIEGDLNLFGFNSPFQTFHGRFKNDKLVNVVLQYREVLNIYAKELTPADIDYITRLIPKYKIKEIAFGEQTRQLFVNYLNKFEAHELRQTFLSVYTPNETSQPSLSATDISLAEMRYLHPIETEVTQWQESVNEVFEVEDSSTTVAEVISDIQNKKSIINTIWQDDELLSWATATAFTNSAAMIIGVGTKECARKNGYATMCVKKLCDDLYKEGRRAVLFYDNQVAGKIYHKLGFVDQENYYLLELKKI
jgi:Predicted acetyltransferase